MTNLSLDNSKSNLLYSSLGFLTGAVSVFTYFKFFYRFESKTDNPIVWDYLNRRGNREITGMKGIYDETWKTYPGPARMMTDVSQAYLFRFLVRSWGCKYAIEVGTFTGSSALAIAEGLSDDGKLICIDPSAKFTNIARKYWKKNGRVENKIDLRLKPATEELAAMISNKELLGKVDFVFIDALKHEYKDYFELALQLLRKGGIIAIDNTLQNMQVPFDNKNHRSVPAIREFNKFLVGDERVEMCLTDIGDGVSFAMKL